MRPRRDAVQDPIPPSEKLLFRFKTPQDLATWNVFTDQEYGGQSEAAITMSDSKPVRGLPGVLLLCYTLAQPLLLGVAYN